MAFRDHHRFTTRDVARVAAAAKSAAASIVLTTAHDAVRWTVCDLDDLPIAAVPLTATVEPADQFREWLFERLRKHALSSSALGYLAEATEGHLGDGPQGFGRRDVRPRHLRLSCQLSPRQPPGPTVPTMALNGITASLGRQFFDSGASGSSGSDINWEIRRRSRAIRRNGVKSRPVPVRIVGGGGRGPVPLPFDVLGELAYRTNTKTNIASGCFSFPEAGGNFHCNASQRRTCIQGASLHQAHRRNDDDHHRLRSTPAAGGGPPVDRGLCLMPSMTRASLYSPTIETSDRSLWK